MNSSDLSKQFSLDYLLSGSKANAPVESTSTRSTDPLFETLSQPILLKLEEQPNRQMKQFQLLDALESTYRNLKIETLSDLLERLQSMGRVRIVERDRHGNHIWQLVPRA